MAEDRELNSMEKKALLETARATLGDLVGKASANEPADLEGVRFQRGAFVTLHKRGMLRGCIGRFTSEEPLVDTIKEMAVAAGSQDPRFPPLSASELGEVDIEISVLSPLRPIKDVSEIQVGVHGIYIIAPRNRGVLLPQVAVEQGWDRDAFLDHTCIKAGLHPGCWQDADVEILIFSAQIFGEKELGPL